MAVMHAILPEAFLTFNFKKKRERKEIETKERHCKKIFNGGMLTDVL